MEEVVVDKSGRLVLPKKIRREFESNVFEVRVVKKEIILKPKKGLAGLFGKAPELSIKAFDKWRREEIKREDTS